MKCIIDSTDRLNRILIGIVLIIGATLSFTREIMLVVGFIQLVEGVLSFCALSCLIVKFRNKSVNK